MIDPEIISYLLPFHKLRRTGRTKIKRNEADRDILARACRLHLTQKVTAKTKATDHFHGWRFSPLGNAFLQNIIEIQGLKKNMADKDLIIKSLEDRIEQLGGEEAKAKENIVQTLENVGTAALSRLMQIADDRVLNTRLREVILSMLKLGKARTERRDTAVKLVEARNKPETKAEILASPVTEEIKKTEEETE